MLGVSRFSQQGEHVCAQRGKCSHIGRGEICVRGACWWKGSGTSHSHRRFSPEPKAWFQACLSLAQLALRGRTQGQEQGVPAGPGQRLQLCEG